MATKSKKEGSENDDSYEEYLKNKKQKNMPMK